jgi:hypothetical protein
MARTWNGKEFSTLKKEISTNPTGKNFVEICG